MRSTVRFTSLFAAAACSAALAGIVNASPAMSLTLHSSAFAANAEIPSVHTCEGKDISPPLSWSGLPAGTRSLALIVDDPDAPDPAAPKRVWVHREQYSLPPT